MVLSWPSMCSLNSSSILVSQVIWDLTFARLTTHTGPNATTFIVPGECFPTRYRSTSHGISAASGKVGAIVAQCVFGPLRQKGAPPGSTESPWLNHVMEIFALFMLCGVFTTFFIPETKRKTLEELAGEVPGTANYDPVSAGHHGPVTYRGSDEETSTVENFESGKQVQAV